MATYSVTYQIVTPESSERGDFAETGFDTEKTEFDGTIASAVELVSDKLGLAHASVYPLSAAHVGMWFESAAPETDWQDASETSYCVHFHGVDLAWIRELTSALVAADVLRQ